MFVLFLWVLLPALMGAFIFVLIWGTLKWGVTWPITVVYILWAAVIFAPR